MHIDIYDHLPREAGDIRVAVFIDEQGFSVEFDERDKDPRVTHLVLWDGDKAAGTCRFFYDDDKETWVIGRVAVLTDFRGKKYGLALMERAEEEIAKRGGQSVWLSAQVQARPFYESLGYIAEGDTYLDEHCPHIDMRKQLPAM